MSTQVKKFNRKEVGEFLKGKRKQLGWNQTELAQALGMTQSNLSKIENGLSDLRLVEFIFFAKAVKFRDFNKIFLGLKN